MRIKVSVVVTVKNDEAGMVGLMEALGGQTARPDEVIIVRSGQNKSYKDYKNYKGRTGRHLETSSRSHPVLPRRILSIFSPGCSRGRGRNIGVKAARNEVIAVTDAGCRPCKDWLERMIAGLYKGLAFGYKGQALSVVAGWYRVAAKTDLQEIMAHFLVPMDYFHENRERGLYKGPTLPRQGRTLQYLPASRSIMFTKAAWEAVGGYPEEAKSGGEDLEFSRRLAANPEVKIIYCPEAVVDWEPPATLGEFFRDIVKHTRGNVEVGYWPHLWRNMTVAGRWGAFVIWPWMIPVYLAWAMGKGIKIINVIKIINIFWYPIIQAVADAGVVWGLAMGVMGRMSRMNLMS